MKDTYKEGIAQIKFSCQRSSQVSLAGRVNHFLFGLALLIPLINSLVLFILQKLYPKEISPAPIILSPLPVILEKQSFPISNEEIPPSLSLQKLEDESNMGSSDLEGDSSTSLIKNHRELEGQSDIEGSDSEGDSSTSLIKNHQELEGQSDIEGSDSEGESENGPPRRSKSASYLDKGVRLLSSDTSSKIVTKMTGVKPQFISSAASNLVISGQALKNGQFKIAAIAGMTSVSSAILGTFNLFVPSEAKMLGRLQGETN